MPLPLRHSRPSAAALVRGTACFALLVLCLGCNKFAARVEFKKGNAFYASETYREALAQFEKGLAIDPNATFAWRSVGLTAMALYRPGLDSPENKGYATTAIDAFEKYLRANPTDQKIEEYIVTMLINSERYDDALAKLEATARQRPGDQGIEQAVVTTLTKANRLDDALARIRKTPRPDPQMLYSIGVACWVQAYNDPMLRPSERGAVVETGLDAVKQALQIKPDYFEAMAYYNLLFREKAKLAIDPLEAQQYYALAEEWTQKALALQKRQQEQQGAAPQPGS